jgi:alpha-D-xyloside xylohydrolase
MPAACPHTEMLVRWFQFGLTSPIFRQHGSRVVEPWTLQQYGASGEAAYEAVVKFIKLRYTIRNYTMTLMEEVATKGTPVNRPLSFDFPVRGAVLPSLPFISETQSQS